MKAMPYERKVYLDRKSRQVIRQRNKSYQPQDRDYRKDKTEELEEEFRTAWAAPAIFTVLTEPHRATLIKALSRLRRQMCSSITSLALDFSQTEKLYADGMLLFWAELKRLLKHIKGRIDITISLPENNKVSQVLKQLGVLDLVGNKAPIVPADHDVINWRAASGDLVQGEKYDVILKQYDGEIAPYLQENLYTGITEAMTNVTNHAYDMPRDDGIGITDQKTWWMFSHQKDGYLSVAFCDLGAGIPRTLPFKRRNVWNRILRKGLNSDSAVIKYAVKDSVSRTKKSHRGKGLRQIMQIVQDIDDGEAVIHSNKGMYAARNGRIEQYEYRDSILGTLIFWKIPLPNREDA